MAPELLRRAVEASVIDVLPGERSVVAKINTSKVDRFRTVIVPSGGNLKDFAKQPAVLWEHGMDPVRGRQPIGRGHVKYRKSENDIIAKTIFGDDEFSDKVFRWYQDGTLTGWSVEASYDWAKSGPPTPAEVKADPDWADARCVFRGWTLTGYAACAYGANPQALTLAVSRGLWVPDDVRSTLPTESPAPPAVEPELPPLTGARTFEQAHAEMREGILRSGRQEADRLRAVADLKRGIV